MKPNQKLYEIHLVVEDFDTGEHKSLDYYEMIFDRELAESWTEDELRKAIYDELTKEDRKDILEDFADEEDE